MAFVLLVFVAADGEEPAFYRLRGAGEESSGGTVNVSPAVHGSVEIVRDLVEVLFDPGVCVPRRPTFEVLVEVTNDAAECRLNLRVVCGYDLEPVADTRRERHVSVVVHDEVHKRWLRAALRFQAGQADLADGKRVEVREQKFAVAKVEPGGLDDARDQFGLVLKIVPVMWGVAGAVSKDERTLPAATRSA